MKLLPKKIVAHLLHYRATGALRVCFALALEALTIGYLYFIGLFTIETLLPTFVTARFSLTLYLAVLVLATMLLALLGHFLDVSFSQRITKKNPLLIIGIIWGISILTISLIKFPPLTILLITLLFLVIGYLFWQVLFEEK